MVAVLTLRLGPVSRLVFPRRIAVLALLAAVLACGFVLSVALGSTLIPLDRVLAVLGGGGTATDRLILIQFRLPRALEAMCVGACLGLAGMLLQRATRNGLASPGVLGVVDGGALGVVLFLWLASDSANNLTVPIVWQPLAAAGCGLALLGLVFLAAKGQVHQPVRLLLFGIALGALAKAGTTLFIVAGPVYQATQALQWVAGSVHTANWDKLRIMAAAALPLAVLTGLLARPLDLMMLDDAAARSAGAPALAVRLAAIVLAGLLTASAVAFAGGIGFVGLLAPHLAGLLLGRGAAAGLAGSALAGAVIVVSADLVVRVLFAPIEVPTGTVTAAIGAPYLLFLLVRRSRADG